MAPERHVPLLVSLSDITYHLTPRGQGDVATVSKPADLDLPASIDALDRLRSLVQSLGGDLGRKSTVSQGETEDGFEQEETSKTLAAFVDGVVGHMFVEQAWPIAEGWLRNKESRRFRIKYGSDVVELGGAADVERALGLMKGAVAAPKKKAAPEAKAKPAKKAASKREVAPKKARAVSAKKSKPAPAKRGKAKPAAKAKAKTKPAKKKARR